MAIRNMLQWTFAYDRVNYARHMTVYWMEMRSLPDTHPATHREMENGGFSVQRSTRSFAKVPFDQTIKNTINRHSKTKGGVVGLSLKCSILVLSRIGLSFVTIIML